MLHILFISTQLCAYYTFWTPSVRLREVKVCQSRGSLLCCTSCWLWSIGSHCFHSLSSERLGGGPENRRPPQGEKTIELCIPLIFVNAKCILCVYVGGEGLTISYYYASKESMISTVPCCFCVAIQTTWKKSFAMFLKGSPNYNHFGSIW